MLSQHYNLFPLSPSDIRELQFVIQYTGNFTGSRDSRLLRINAPLTLFETFETFEDVLLVSTFATTILFRAQPN